MPISPFFTNRPNDFHVLNPATQVAWGAFGHTPGASVI
jgi:hypothetical protein